MVIGGSGLIGSKLVRKLLEHGHKVVPASLDSGVNTLTGEGLAEALDSTAVVVDVSNSPSLEDAAVLMFFETSTGNFVDAEAAAGVGHHVALSVVGTERLSESGYFRAKIAQEKLIKRSSIQYSIVHATQFFEFIERIADDATNGNTVQVAPVLIQPMAAEDVASAVGRISIGPPVNGIVEVGGTTVPSPRTHPTIPQATPRSTRGDHRSARALLRCRTGRAHTLARRRRQTRRDPLRRLA